VHTMGQQPPPGLDFLADLHQATALYEHWVTLWLQLLPKIIRGFGMERGILALAHGPQRRLDIAIMEGDYPGGASTHAISVSTVRRVLETGESAMWADTAAIEAAGAVTESVARLGLCHIMCVPLAGLRKPPLGVLYVDSNIPGAITEETKTAFEGIATILALVAEAGGYVDEESVR
jgi:transcriptional regulator with GAF, ATPase, and Fis domain